MSHEEEMSSEPPKEDTNKGLKQVTGAAKRRRPLRLSGNYKLNPTKSAIKRVARRGGVKRISAFTYEETRGVLRVYLENLIRDAIQYMECGKRKTVTVTDVENALRFQGKPMYR
ncbi:hypothetical protein FSP39_025317 [Pinctada imbricata]|uniref:Histone H4 n=1 Tax=Pinctada imbricata TaxID=66713 RepID=A0AA88YA97_PINIB|nr:hypothetical protein FSP39_025317 [Pinctada imbricata]